ncbi:MAG TPA: PRC-barrel domain-containing protein [Geminicoccaceae bacterium]|nr:PRC-barrel domain-containing protein [Geminicoccaceae bacterium]
MRKLMLAASVVALTMPGLALAQTQGGTTGTAPVLPPDQNQAAGATAGAAPAAPADQAAGTTTSPAEPGMAAGQDATATPPAATADTGTTTMQPSATTGTVTTAPDMIADDDATWRSYAVDREGFQGTVAGGHSVDNLMNRDVVDMNGNSIASVSDLLIGADGTISKVLIDVGGFLGIGARTVAVDIEQLQVQPGEDGDLVVSMTEEQIRNLPAYEQEDGNWRMTR